MSMFDQSDHDFMREAYQLAQRAGEVNEVPVGAVIVLNDEIIGRGYNSPIEHRDPTAHAEILALRDASNTVQNYRLPNTTLYVTLEPCMMCVGAIVHARVKRVVFGANDPKSGASHLFESDFLNHRVLVEGGLMAKECGDLLSEFFRVRRLG